MHAAVLDPTPTVEDYERAEAFILELLVDKDDNDALLDELVEERTEELNSQLKEAQEEIVRLGELRDLMVEFLLDWDRGYNDTAVLALERARFILRQDASSEQPGTGLDP